MLKGTLNPNATEFKPSGAPPFTPVKTPPTRSNVSNGVDEDQTGTPEKSVQNPVDLLQLIFDFEKEYLIAVLETRKFLFHFLKFRFIILIFR